MYDVALQELQNAFLHRTDEYEQDPDGKPDLLVRRGQDFSMEINLNRRFYPEREKFILRFAAKGKRKRSNHSGKTKLGLSKLDKTINEVIRKKSLS